MRTRSYGALKCKKIPFFVGYKSLTFCPTYGIIIKYETYRDRKGGEKKWLQSKSEKTKRWTAHCVVSRDVAPATVSSATFVKRNSTKNRA